ncbi:MAG: hypothetical protein IME96_02080 [Proteobacteria bacterium]|nr:hypothetical protein [Pseudomonadota bacterium]
MAEILIKPIKTKTHNGTDAEITGIDLTSTDCIVGTASVNHGSPDKSWNIHGICRDNPDDLNLNLNSNEIADLMETIKKLQG